MTTWLLLAAAILCEVAATLSLKGALDRPALYVVVVAGYMASFTLLAAVLRRGMGLGVAYGIWSACGVTLRRSCRRSSSASASPPSWAWASAASSPGCCSSRRGPATPRSRT